MDFVLAVNNFGDTRSGGLAGPMGLFIIVLMAISTVLLIRNMNKRLRRLPDSFPDPAAAAWAAEIARPDADRCRPARHRRRGIGLRSGHIRKGCRGHSRGSERRPGDCRAAGRRRLSAKH
jgi:hypothetical protein